MRLGIIGFGNMASAILGGVLQQGLFAPSEVLVADPNAEHRAQAAALGVSAAESNADLCRSCDLVLLAVKPQIMPVVLQEIAPAAAGTVFVSIAAGISTEYLRSFLGVDTPCVRVMPNTPMLLGCGAIAIAYADGVPEASFDLVCRMFAAAGTVRLIQEDQMDEIIGVNGSSPAFFFRMAAAMEEAAAQQGIDRGVARELIAATMEGSALMLQKSGKTAAELTAQVTSPGGTTLAALTAFDELGFDALLQEAMLRCTRRSKELGR